MAFGLIGTQSSLEPIFHAGDLRELARQRYGWVEQALQWPSESGARILRVVEGFGGTPTLTVEDGRLRGRALATPRASMVEQTLLRNGREASRRRWSCLHEARADIRRTSDKHPSPRGIRIEPHWVSH